MNILSDEVMHFLQHQQFSIVSTIDRNGLLHNACKGIVDITSDGRIYLLDLYRARTFENLKLNPHLSITAVDGHRFVGYCLKGEAKIVKRKNLSSRIIKAWEKKIAARITQRLLKEVRGEKGHRHHPEVLLPKPEYLIAMKVEEVVNLTPHHIKQVKA